MKSERCIALNDDTEIMIKLRRSRNEAIRLFMWRAWGKSRKWIRIIALPRNEFGTHTSRYAVLLTTPLLSVHISYHRSLYPVLWLKIHSCDLGRIAKWSIVARLDGMLRKQKGTYLHYKTKINIGLWYRKDSCIFLGLRLLWRRLWRVRACRLQHRAVRKEPSFFPVTRCYSPEDRSARISSITATISSVLNYHGLCNLAHCRFRTNLEVWIL